MLDVSGEGVCHRALCIDSLLFHNVLILSEITKTTYMNHPIIVSLYINASAPRDVMRQLPTSITAGFTAVIFAEEVQPKVKTSTYCMPLSSILSFQEQAY